MAESVTISKSTLIISMLALALLGILVGAAALRTFSTPTAGVQSDVSAIAPVAMTQDRPWEVPHDAQVTTHENSTSRDAAWKVANNGAKGRECYDAGNGNICRTKK